MPLSAHNQPLGVLVAEKAKAQNIPYAIVTSGHGAHGDISTPVAVFLKEKGIIRGVRGNYAGEERPGRTLCRYIRNGQIATFEEFKADSLAGSSRKFYLENPDSLINYYNMTRNDFERTLSQAFFTNADKHKQATWEDIIKWMEYIVKENGDKSLPAQTPPQQ